MLADKTATQVFLRNLAQAKWLRDLLRQMFRGIESQYDGQNLPCGCNVIYVTKTAAGAAVYIGLILKCKEMSEKIKHYRSNVNGESVT